MFMRIAIGLALTCTAGAQFAGTQPLAPMEDRSAAMVAGMDAYLAELTRRVTSQPHPQASRERLAELIGAQDQRLPITALEVIATTQAPAVLAESETSTVQRVRWAVLSGLHGEGLLIQPQHPAIARVIYVPDCETMPEQMVRDAALLYSQCEVVIPALLSRRNKGATNIPMREWIYRQAFVQGRHLIGYEVMKVLSVVDAFTAQSTPLPIIVAGQGEGGQIALYAGALDPRITAVYSAGYFAPRASLWAEPLDRNVWSLLKHFGDAEIAALIAPRKLAVQYLSYPSRSYPSATNGRSLGAPGMLSKPTLDDVQAEAHRARALAPGDWLKLCTEEDGAESITLHSLPKAVADALLTARLATEPALKIAIDHQREPRQLQELEALLQDQFIVGEADRSKAFWQPIAKLEGDAWQTFTATQREHFWNDAMGRLPDPDVPPAPQSRLVQETEKVRLYEVTLSVWDGVFAWAWVALPKSAKLDQRQPIVVCQHGLEGVPEDVFNADPQSKAYKPYQAFALRLAEQGFITVAPHNPYRGGDAFRRLQRRAQPLGLTLFSLIIGQHQQMLTWLKGQPWCDPQRIAFYGLSYGGKSAMRIPAVLPDYCLSICSGDFNEWVRKCASTTMPMSYVFTPEHEIWEWNLGSTFNYAEMAALIAPRPFMVERGHRDGVGLDEWVNYEFAKVQRFYDQYGLANDVRIEHFDGPHTIHGVGTFEFLREKLQ
jgi:cephalosporin-C deacetylase-like acetyl esterase